MSLSKFLSGTIGRLVPRYRTLGEWAVVFRQIVAGKQIDDHTRANRRCTLNHVLAGLGPDRVLGSIKPHEVSAMIMQMHKTRPQLAKRMMIETKDMLNEAVNYGWIDRSPAALLRAPRVKVQRRRLTLEQWQLIHAWAFANMAPWVARMMVLALVTGQRRGDLCKMRFVDVWDGHLHIEQEKTGMRIALPLALRLNVLGVSIGEAIEACRDYAPGDEYLLRKSTGKPPVLASLSARFEDAREAVLPAPDVGIPTSLHECRSLSERLYREQGVNTMILLGHKHQAMTDIYNDDRGLSAGTWKTLVV